MTYTKQTWTDGSGGGTPISAARLTHMEDGIDDADTRATALEASVTSLDGRLDTVETDITGADTRISALEDGAEFMTVAEWMATVPNFVAHRGSGGEAPEHTLAAYRQATAAGAPAIEVSVNVTRDGTLVCIHDTTLTRTTYSTGNVADYSTPVLTQTVLTNGRTMLGQGWTDQPIPTLRQVLDEFIGKVVIFLEPKGNDAVVPLQQFLTKFYPEANKSVVWKAHVGTSFTWPKNNGFTTWCYLDAGTTDGTMDAKDAQVDIWGLPYSMTDVRMIDVLNRAGGKPAMCWEVHRQSEYTRLRNLVDGTRPTAKKAVDYMMCSEFLYLNRLIKGGAAATADEFPAKVKSPGNLGNTYYDPLTALKYEDTGGWAFLNTLGGAACPMGWNCPIVPGAAGYKITFDWKYIQVPGSTIHAGFYFGAADDSRHLFSSTINTVSGYRWLLRGNGDMQLYTYTAGVASGAQLATVNIGTITPDATYSFEIEVNPTNVISRCTTTSTTLTPSPATTVYRGLHFGIHNGTLTDVANAPRIKTLRVVPLT